MAILGIIDRFYKKFTTITAAVSWLYSVLRVDGGSAQV
jgi:hypothetical protein